jgi:hypothetical protein
MSIMLSREGAFEQTRKEKKNKKRKRIFLLDHSDRELGMTMPFVVIRLELLLLHLVFSFLFLMKDFCLCFLLTQKF